MAPGKDRLSELGDDLLCYEILSKLPLRDAVRSSILSTRWRLLWRKIPHLHFSYEFYHCFSDLVICSHMGNYWDCADIIDNVFQQHSAPLTSCKFHPWICCTRYTEKIEEWIERIRVKGVKEIVIISGYTPPVEDPSKEASYSIPTNLFACQTLTALELGYFGLTGTPESCLGFPCLVSCSLHFIVASNEKNELQDFIALCPQLQNLRLSKCLVFNNLKIGAQHLKYLKLKYCTFKTFIVDCPRLVNLEEIDCEFGALEKDHYYSGLSSFKVSSPTSLCDVNVSDFCLLERLSAAKTITKISIGICKLQCASGFLNMLANFPNLERLTLNECMIESRNMETVKEMGIASDINFPNLKEVVIDFLCMTSGNEVAMLNFLVVFTY
ncbi:F-box/LRR-repeat protein At3g26922-like [Cryptomeria japonica]|uniref:F-box/LRR-repeat protein At3g26922-like n=1 Tax=Cryptomeria japonica TaxID=3369 RepID=UPI0027DA41D3|nr:F-box/LRR-repeat protein At3g26922-like [Cryptomeria japonica]